MRLLYFAWLKERMGMAEEALDLPPGVETVSALLDWLAGRDPRHAAALARRDAIRVAVNQVHVTLDHRLASGDEVALFPPVTGG